MAIRNAKGQFTHENTGKNHLNYRGGKLILKCFWCKKIFEAYNSQRKGKREGRIYCSHKCYGEDLKGRSFKWSHKRKTPVWNKGLPEEKSPLWKGENIAYRSLHEWVDKHKGKPMKCGKCNIEGEKFYDWANISGEYKRYLDDWIRLCRKCHQEMDKNMKGTLKKDYILKYEQTKRSIK